MRRLNTTALTIITALSVNKCALAEAPELGRLMICDQSHAFDYSRLGAENMVISVKMDGSAVINVTRTTDGNCEGAKSSGDAYSAYTPYNIIYRTGGTVKLMLETTPGVHSGYGTIFIPNPDGEEADTNRDRTTIKWVGATPSYGNYPVASILGSGGTVTIALDRTNLHCSGAWC